MITVYILGLNYLGHDASASLLKNGELIASSMEERFSGVKNDRSFPINAINFCLEFEDISINNIEVITYYLIPDLFHEKLVVPYLDKYPKPPLLDSLLDRDSKYKSVEQEIRSKLNFSKKIFFCDHHNAHIALSFFLSNFKEAAVISVDGSGEVNSTVMAVVKNNKIEVLKELEFPNSLGMLYMSITHYLGFNATSDAGKVMGLSSYGNSSTYIKQFREIIKLSEDGAYEMEMDYFEFQNKRSVWVSEKFLNTFGPTRSSDEELEEKHKDIAAALQRRLEEVFFHMGKYLKDKTNMKYLCLSGGVALNSVANGKLLQKEYFKDIFIPPATGDDGTSIGAPLYYNYCVLNNTKRFPFVSPFLGPEYHENKILKIIKRFGLKYQKSNNICKDTAKLLSENKIIGWYQGRMEIGPRALGNRSIIGNPGHREMKELLNSRVKFRESFRPFAPSILSEDVKEWFEYDHPAPYMLFVFKIKKEKKEKIPAVTHVDGTGRLQSVNKEFNPRYYNLINEFKKITGIPMIINTSFNIMGKPIVESPSDAIECFLGCGIDCLVLGDYLINKESQ